MTDKNNSIDNTRYFDNILRSYHRVHIFIMVTLASVVVVLGVKVYRLSSLENVYVLSADQTLVATRPEDTNVRSEHEITAFARIVLEKAFANNRHSLEDNLRQVSEWMDITSAHLFLTKFDESNLKNMYFESNCISTVALDKIDMELGRSPIPVGITYTTFLNFLKGKIEKAVYKNKVVKGKMYFEIRVVKRSFKNPYGMQITNFKFMPVEQPLEQEDNE